MLAGATIMDDTKRDSGIMTTRRTFLAMAGAMGAGAFLLSHTPEVLAAIDTSGTKLVWLRGSGCGGCTGSFLNGGNPDILTALKKLDLSIAYHETFMQQQGIFVDGEDANTLTYNANMALKDVIENGRYILVVEGAIPNGPNDSGKYCMVGGRTFRDVFQEAAASAQSIVALGTCASFGGLSRMQKDVDALGVAYTGTSRLNGAMSRLGLSKQVINVPGCPAHPDWAILTLADLLSGNEVELDMYRRPKAFFGAPVHESCLHRGAFDRASRDDHLSDGGCLYNVGCKGILAYADCPTRRWNGGLNMCTQSGGPCVACAEPEFPEAFMPFFKKTENKDILSGLDVDTGAKMILGAAVIGAGIHAVKRLAIGESGRDEQDEKGRR
jgi:hydrogenase small subunit